jgi:predicted DNA-binding transcriptional regulator YafY
LWAARGSQPGSDRLCAGVGPCVGEVAGGLHSSQELTELGEGRLQVKLRLNSLDEVERWVLSFGVHARVIGPEELRERVERALEIARMHAS